MIMKEINMNCFLLSSIFCFVLPKDTQIDKRFCFRLKKKRDFDFENAVKSKAVKPKMPTLTPKISDLLFMT